jgi:uncharacterized damage-inducible protein DinB
VLNAATQLSESQLYSEAAISHGSIFGTLLHIAGAEWIWLERWRGQSPCGPEAWSRWKVGNCPTLDRLRAQWQEVIEGRNSFLAGVSEERLNSQSPFTLISGESDSLILIEQMQHLVNHGTLHRGQVVGMIRQLGIAPPATDLLFYLRSHRS